MRLRYRRSFTPAQRGPLILMTQRRRLDAYLAEQAAAAGAEFRDGAEVGDVEVGDGGVTATVGGERVAADVLVGADGANGVVAKAAGLGAGIVRGVALEGNVPLGAARPRALRGDRGGRARVVPRRLWLALPEGRPREPRRRRLGERGAEACARTWRGSPHAMGRPRRPRVCAATDCRCAASGSAPARGRVLLVGDAAGLVDPLSGDGMYEAFVSARLACRGDRWPALSTAMTRLVGRSTRPPCRRVVGRKRALDRYPSVCFWAARSPGVFGVVSGLLRGDVRHPSEASGPGPAAAPRLSRLARHATPPA